jgi:hypothetical protein
LLIRVIQPFVKAAVAKGNMAEAERYVEKTANGSEENIRARIAIG